MHYRIAIHPTGWTAADGQSTTDALRICLYASDVDQPIKTAVIRGAAAANWVNRVVSSAREVSSVDCSDNGDQTVLAFTDKGLNASLVVGNAGCPTLDLGADDGPIRVLPIRLIDSLNAALGPGPLMTVPDVIGLHLNDATSYVVKTGLLVNAGPYSDPHRQYLVVGQSPVGGARVHRTTVFLKLLRLPRAAACTSDQVRVVLRRANDDATNGDFLSYDVVVTNVSTRMCSLAGAPLLQFWSRTGEPLAIAVQRFPSEALFDDLSPEGASRPWYRVASVSMSLASGSSCSAAALHPTSITVTSGNVVARVPVGLPPAGVCAAGSSIQGFDPE